MTGSERLDALTARARLEHAPPVDVTDRVMAALRIRAGRACGSDMALTWIAAAAAAIAIPALFLAWSQLHSWAEPLVVMLGDAPWELIL